MTKIKKPMSIVYRIIDSLCFLDFKVFLFALEIDDRRRKWNFLYAYLGRKL